MALGEGQPGTTLWPLPEARGPSSSQVALGDCPPVSPWMAPLKVPVLPDVPRCWFSPWPRQHFYHQPLYFYYETWNGPSKFNKNCFSSWWHCGVVGVTPDCLCEASASGCPGIMATREA